MNLLKRKIDYFIVLKYLVYFILCCIFNNFEKEVYPYSISLLSANLCLNNSFLASSILFIFSLILNKAEGLVLPSLFSIAFFAIIKLIYLKSTNKPHFEFVLYCLISLAPFVAMDKVINTVTYEKKILVSLITTFLSFLSIVASNSISKKKFRFKPDFIEIISFVCLSIFTGIGICNLLSPMVLKGLAIFIVLSASFIYRFGMGSLISMVFGISLSIYYHNLEYVSMLIILGMLSDCFTNFSKYVSSIMLLAGDYFIELLFHVNGTYGVNELLPTVVGVVAFLILPSKPLLTLKDKILSFKEKQLIRQSINRNRIMLSNRLYELSSVFSEMSVAFNNFNKKRLTEDKAKTVLIKEISQSICKDCKNKLNCKGDKDYELNIQKMIDIGFAKGKLSLIDFPLGLEKTCIHPNDIIFSINKMLAEFRSFEKEYENVVNGRALLADEADGVSEILRGLALESGSTLKYQSKTEKRLNDALLKHGYFASEILIYGENESTTVNLILSMKEFSIKNLQRVISEVLGFDVILVEKNDITNEKCFLSFKISSAYDAVFGISKTTKNGSKISGDTHSVLRISDDKFLVALSDGMGSGEFAESISSVSLSLIESFYKAGMTSNLILNTVNKLLSINAEDSFTALDVSVIDLKTCDVDFVKYGAPYGFIINNGSVKIVEGNTLPLGILNDLKPSICHTTLNDGDMILLLTDGISDAFGSSGEIIDFLRNAPAFNPQTLTNVVLNKAVELSGGEKKDDMTALAVRIFKKQKIA